jgi:hypothetical protein
MDDHARAGAACRQGTDHRFLLKELWDEVTDGQYLRSAGGAIVRRTAGFSLMLVRSDPKW